MARLFKKKHETKKTLWRRAVDLALTDVRVLAGKMDHETLETLEERLLAADFGVPASMRLVDHVEGLVRRGKIREGTELRAALMDEVRRILNQGPDRELRAADTPPTVYLIAGVNG
ncbi:MAG TPA: signal recognition particle receptor subunit alpha, partial [Longimicrobiales bacterium]|nr:signal recognition particle receptor subunit alpha [Longimicrobiales bacterium]